MKILLAGDVMLGRLVNRVLAKKPPAWPWGDTLGLFESADLRIVNLECVISDRGEPWKETSKVFHFRSDARNIATLAEARVDAVTLANNHALDYGPPALLDMLSSLDRHGIGHCGAGVDSASAMAPAYLSTVGGDAAALISFTDNEPAWEAGPGRPGVNYVPVEPPGPSRGAEGGPDERAERLLALVASTRAGMSAGVVIVSAHWGGNWGYHPPEAHREFGRALVEAGADVVFGHSCHVVRGVELYRGRPIIYSAGDFVDDYAVDPVERNDEAFIFIVSAEGGTVTGLELVPTVIGDFQARLARGRRASSHASLMVRLCGELGTRAVWDEARGRVVVKG